jgi:hypothetical protein
VKELTAKSARVVFDGEARRYLFVTEEGPITILASRQQVADLSADGAVITANELRGQRNG